MEKNLEQPKGCMNFDLASFTINERNKNGKVVEIYINPKSTKKVFTFKYLDKQSKGEFNE